MSFIFHCQNVKFALEYLASATYGLLTSPEGNIFCLLCRNVIPIFEAFSFYSPRFTCFLLHLRIPPQLFLERERAAILAEAKTDDLISEAPKPALDQSGEWQETSGEIQWVAAETNDNQTENKESEKKEEEDEELDLNKGWCCSS